MNRPDSAAVVARTCLAIAAMLLGNVAIAQSAGPDTGAEVTNETAPEPLDQPPVSPAVELPTRWLLVCCGLPGDQEHRERLTRACRKLIAAATPVLGVTPERLHVLAGDEAMRDALAGAAPQVGITTKDSVARTLQDLSDEVDPDDACWVILLGHAHLYGTASQFNVLDSDFDQRDFAVWAESLDCREQVFWITMPVSGFWIKPLASQSRVVISATEPDLEFTGTEMPYALADLLTSSGESRRLEDVDRDGSLSLLDLYLAANLEIHDRFVAIERLQTEHAQLEDNGDGRGTEVQLAYLPDEEAEEAEVEADSTDAPTSVDEEEANDVPPPISNQNLDGYRSRFIPLGPPWRKGDGGHS